jgi:hypothetical protein
VADKTFDHHRNKNSRPWTWNLCTSTLYSIFTQREINSIVGMEASFGSVLDVQKETDPIRRNIMVWICVAGDILQITIQFNIAITTLKILENTPWNALYIEVRGLRGMRECFSVYFSVKTTSFYCLQGAMYCFLDLSDLALEVMSWQTN